MEKSYYKDYFILEKEHWLFKIRRKIFFYFIKKYLPSGSKILDFGCGSGYLVGELQKIGYDAYGIDFEKEAIDYGVNSGIRNLVLGNGQKTEHSDKSFDMIVAFDVLEHIEDEKPIIGELLRILRPGGKLMITVPAYQWLWGVQDDVSHHFRRYTAGSLVNVFKNFLELKIVRKTYFNTLLFPPIAVIRLFSKWFDVKNRKSDFDIKTGFLDVIFYHIFNLEYYFLMHISLPFGVSLLLILEKNGNNI